MSVTALRKRRIGRIKQDAFQCRKCSAADCESVSENPGVIEFTAQPSEHVVFSGDMRFKFVSAHGFHYSEHNVGLDRRSRRNRPGLRGAEYLIDGIDVGEAQFFQASFRAVIKRQCLLPFPCFI